ncbi:MAG: chromate transporter [Deltaproteobacteria bacterium]|nr:chromate transporter [Deltaproteobacteria bacterium]
MWELFAAFFRVGLFGYGGGPSMIPLVQAECVGAGWVTEQQFLEGLAAGYALPGPIALKMAAWVGWQEGGWLGALVALVGVTLPGVALMGLLAGIIVRYHDNPWVAGAMRGARPAVVGMLFYVAVDLAPSGVTGWAGAILAGVAFAALVARVHPAFVVAGSVLIGMYFFRQPSP